MLTLVLLIGALVCFLLAAVGVPSRVGLVPLGLALITVTLILPAAHL